MKTLEEFLANYGDMPWSAYVKHPEFRSLYLRRSPSIHFLEGKCITIANVEAKKKGKGSFTRLSNRLIAQGYAVVLENVLSDQFVQGLMRAGYKYIPRTSPPSFIKRPQ